MKKNTYDAPFTGVVAIQQEQLICASTVESDRAMNDFDVISELELNLWDIL